MKYRHTKNQNMHPQCIALKIQPLYLIHWQLYCWLKESMRRFVRWYFKWNVFLSDSHTFVDTEHSSQKKHKLSQRTAQVYLTPLSWFFLWNIAFTFEPRSLSLWMSDWLWQTCQLLFHAGDKSFPCDISQLLSWLLLHFLHVQCIIRTSWCINVWDLILGKKVSHSQE